MRDLVLLYLLLRTSPLLWEICEQLSIQITLVLSGVSSRLALLYQDFLKLVSVCLPPRLIVLRMRSFIGRLSATHFRVYLPEAYMGTDSLSFYIVE